MGTSKVPAWFLMQINDEGLKRNIRRVWRRLPACDRAVLRDQILDVTVSPTAVNGVFGSAGPCSPNGTFNGNAAEVAEGDPVIVTLCASSNYKSDAAAMFVIAHEFAHVVLRHKQMSLVAHFMEQFKLYGEEAMDSMREWHEDEADLQAWLWGFKAEMAACLAEFPDTRRPRWNVEIAWEMLSPPPLFPTPG